MSEIERLMENDRRASLDTDMLPMEIIDPDDYIDPDDAHDAYLDQAETNYWQSHRVAFDDNDRPYIARR